MSPSQLATSVLAVLVAALVAAMMIAHRGTPRRWGFAVLCVCAAFAIATWTRFGDFHDLFVDESPSEIGPGRRKVLEHRPLQFHEFVHYYVGAKYFRELGYLGLYDCIALADREIADEDHIPPRITGFVRDLDDVLRDKPYEAALAQCRAGARTRISPARWASFKSDLRELQRLVPDDYWASVVYDAGFNPPPSWILLGSSLANVIPIRAGGTPFYLLATSLDLALLIACLLALRAAFGNTAAALWAVYFGASYIGEFVWNGGSFLRFTWMTAVLFGIVALKRGRWVLAGALLGAAACDRIFPAVFALCAMLPVIARARASAEHRRILGRFGAGFAATVLVLLALSCAVFGLAAWTVFVSRIGRHGDVYYVMHIALKKVLTYRAWVPNQDFRDHAGLVRFHDWNVHLRETWASMRLLVVPLQLLALAATAWAAVRRRPYEAALLGAVLMFVFSMPANYYYVVVAVVPALLFRGAATAPTVARRLRDYAAFVAFNAFWMLTLVASFMSPDAIVYDFYICCAYLAFVLVWLVSWVEPGSWRVVRAALRAPAA